MKSLAIASVLLFVVANTCSGFTIRVPGDQPTIQAGIDATINGDIVLVAGGTYTGSGNRNITFSGKKITVRSEGGEEPAVIDCEYKGRGFVFDSGETPGSVLTGFTIMNGFAENGHLGGRGGGLYISGCSPTISKCEIVECGADHGGGISCDNSDAEISTCIIRENRTSDSGIGGGIATDFYSTTLISNCSVSGNEADWSGGGLSFLNSASAVLEFCNVTDNSSGRTGGGIHGESNICLDVFDCDIKRNVSDCGGGVYCHDNSSMVLAGSTLAQNISYSSGGGIWNSDGSSMDVAGCLIAKNVAYTPGFGGGGGIACWSSSLVLSRCFLAENGTTGKGGAVYCRSYAKPAVINCTISANTAGSGGGVYLRDLDSAEFLSCIIWNNSADEIHVRNSSLAVTYSDVQAGWPGEGNIDEDPCFADPGENDYDLLEGSPCINAGDPLSLPPVGGGRMIDIGAFEYDFGWRMSSANSAR